MRARDMQACELLINLNVLVWLVHMSIYRVINYNIQEHAILLQCPSTAIFRDLKPEWQVQNGLVQISLGF